MICKDGRVWSIRNNRHLQPIRNSNGYLRYTLYKNGRPKTWYAHRLVATHFIPNPKHLPQVHHIDGNRENNHVENLKWVTARQNCNYGDHRRHISKSLTGRNVSKDTRRRISKARGTGPVLQYDLNGKFICEWRSMSMASRMLQINVSGISKCCRGIYRQSGGYIWRRKEQQRAA